jgi:hypothetical protein
MRPYPVDHRLSVPAFVADRRDRLAIIAAVRAPARPGGRATRTGTGGDPT